MSGWPLAQSVSHATMLAVTEGRTLLTEGGVSPDEAPQDARILLAHAAGLRRDQMHRLDLSDFTPSLRQAYLALVARRAAGEPISKIIGRRDFWRHSLIVTPDVLDPRPETEILVAEALVAPFDRVLDLGTGSGAILLSLLADRPAATGVGADLSPLALEVALRNAEELQVEGRVQFITSDWFSAVSGMFDLIVSNPPYIALDEMPALSREVSGHDPRMALTDEGDGLSVYRILAAQSPKYLQPQGRLLMEIGPTQGQAVCTMLHEAGFQGVKILPDLDGRDRVVCGQMP